jgi:ABC-type uncharacterized transport system substrate-binding protein
VKTALVNALQPNPTVQIGNTNAPRIQGYPPDHPAVDYLVRLHADLGGQIQANKAEAIRLAEAMKHVEAVIKLFDPDYNVRAISVRRRQKTNIAQLALRFQLPAISIYRQFVVDAGLMAYGPDSSDIFRRSAEYVDRILKGESPADLPVQAPTKFNFIINLRTAKSLGLTPPPTLLALADEVIE